MPYKDPARQAAAMKVIRARYETSLKGMDVRSSRRNIKAKIRRNNRRQKETDRQFIRGGFYDIVKQDQGGRCAYCRIQLREKGGQIDRVVPGQKYSEGNCVLACAECNMHKRNHDVNDFLDDMLKQELIPPGKWIMPGGRYHRPEGDAFQPNPDYEGALSQILPEPKKEP